MKPNFTVIRGGKSLSPECRGRKFVSGYATNTRLMGVIGLELKWDVVEDSQVKTLNQIFYLDAEEFGLESYTEAYGDNPHLIAAERRRLIGALGGSVVPVTEEEARFLIQSYVKINKKFKQELAEGYENYKFLLLPEQALSLENYESLVSRICGHIDLPNYILNYFLMRTFAKDIRGAAFLIAPSALQAKETDDSQNTPPGDTVRFEKRQNSENPPAPASPVTVTPDYLPDIPDFGIYPLKQPAALCRNTIESFGNLSDRTYMCESVVEYGNRYHIITSEIKLQMKPCRVVSARRCSAFTITSAEAAMIMNCSEFITVYEVDSDSTMFQDSFSAYVEAFTETAYDNGRLYIDFYDTNDHVGRQVYKMNDDIRAMYYLTDSNQLLVIAYTFEAVFEAELHITFAMMPNYMQVIKKFEFKEPVVYEFIKSDFEDFDEFLSLVCKKPEN